MSLAQMIEGHARAAQLEERFVHPFLTYLRNLHAKHAECREGTVADYIPELGKANPDWFGICMATVDGRVYEVGDTRQNFTIQSISKPFVYGMALQDSGLKSVLDHVGVEPSGDAFNSISLQRESGRPFNPMINAGAIAATGLIKGNSPEEKYERLLHQFGEYVGHELTIDEVVYRSEAETGDRNRAIGYMLRNVNKLDSRPEPVLDLYFRQCSLLVDCRDLAVMAATLANGGVSPMTGRTVLDPRFVPRVLSVMGTCGMYDYSGEWLYRVGMPSKSGVGGGIIGVLPGHLGIAVFSPPLDSRGNSVRGINVFAELSEDFELHLFNVTRSLRNVVRTRYDASQVGSKRVRRSADTQYLAEEGRRIVTYELQGELTLSSMEMVIRDVMELPDHVEYLVFDFKRIVGADRPALGLFTALLQGKAADGICVVLTNVTSQPEMAEHFEGVDSDEFLFVKPDNDSAIEFCENRVIAQRSGASVADEEIELLDFDLLRGLHFEEVRTLRRMLYPKSFSDGELIIRQGDEADRMYLLTKGQVSVTIDVEGGKTRRLATCSPGMVFGEMAIIERRPRSADVRADGPVECYEFRIAEFDRLSKTYPSIKFAILENIARGLSARVRKLTDEVRTLSR